MQILKLILDEHYFLNYFLKWHEEVGKVSGTKKKKTSFCLTCGEVWNNCPTCAFVSLVARFSLVQNVCERNLSTFQWQKSDKNTKLQISSINAKIFMGVGLNPVKPNKTSVCKRLSAWYNDSKNKIIIYHTHRSSHMPSHPLFLKLNCR